MLSLLSFQGVFRSMASQELRILKGEEKCKLGGKVSVNS